MADPLLWINFVLGSFEILVIAVFTYFTIKYIWHFKDEKLDPATILVFILVFMTAIFKIIPRFVFFTLAYI